MNSYVGIKLPTQKIITQNTSLEVQSKYISTRYLMFLYTSGTVHCSSPSYQKVTTAIREPRYIKPSFPPIFIPNSCSHLRWRPIHTSFKHQEWRFTITCMARWAMPTKWLHTLLIASRCPRLSEVALKEATSFASICCSSLSLSTDQPCHLLIMRCWIQERLLPNSFSWLAFSNCSFSLLNCTSSIPPSKCKFHMNLIAITIGGGRPWYSILVAWFVTMNSLTKSHSSAVWFQGWGNSVDRREKSLSRR